MPNKRNEFALFNLKQKESMSTAPKCEFIISIGYNLIKAISVIGADGGIWTRTPIRALPPQGSVSAVPPHPHDTLILYDF